MDKIIGYRKEIEGLNSTKLFNERQLDSLSNVAGFADRNYALGQLSYNPDGSRDLDTYLAISFISFLFILLECLPVFVKLMSDKGPFDVALQDLEEIAIYQSAKNKDHHIIVTDQVFDTRNDAETEKNKILIKRKVAIDLEEN